MFLTCGPEWEIIRPKSEVFVVREAARIRPCGFIVTSFRPLRLLDGRRIISNGTGYGKVVQ